MLLSKVAPPSHLRDVPEYMVDPKVKEASKMVKLHEAARDMNKSRRRPGFRRGSGKSRDPLKTFSVEVHGHKLRLLNENYLFARLLCPMSLTCPIRLSFPCQKFIYLLSLVR